MTWLTFDSSLSQASAERPRSVVAKDVKKNHSKQTNFEGYFKASALDGNLFAIMSDKTTLFSDDKAGFAQESYP